MLERISSEIINGFKRDFVSTDHIGTAILVLLALYKEDYQFLDELDDSNKDKKMILLYRDLVYKGYLNENEDNEDSTNVHFSLSSKGVELVENLNQNNDQKITFIKLPKVVEAKEVFVEPEIKEKEPESENIEDWIRSWITLFPVKSPKGFTIRTATANCINKMNIILKANPKYNKDLIFKATKLYLEDQQKSGNEFISMAGNFISKSESGRGSVRNSILSTYCDLILYGNDEPKEEFRHLEDNNPFL